MKGELSPQFINKLRITTIKLFELIEINAEPDVADGWISDTVAQIDGVIDGVHRWRRLPENQTLMATIDGLQYRTHAMSFGMFLCVYYRNAAGDIWWFADVLESWYWEDCTRTREGVEHHIVQWKKESEPQFIVDAINRSDERFDMTEPDFTVTNPDGNPVNWYLTSDLAFELDYTVFQSARDDFLLGFDWLENGHWAMGIGGALRPFLVIRSELNYYLHIIPPTLGPKMITWAKNNKIYAKVKFTEQCLMEQLSTRNHLSPKRSSATNFPVTEFIDRCLARAKNPPAFCEVYPSQMLLADGSVWLHTNYWHPSAQAGIDLLTDLFNAGIDASDYYNSFPHIQPFVENDWVLLHDRGDLYIEVRDKNNIYGEKVPSSVAQNEIIDLAVKKARMFESPRFLLNKRGNENVSYLGPK